MYKAVKLTELLKIQSKNKQISVSFFTDCGIIYFDDTEDEESDALLNLLFCVMGQIQFILMIECNLTIRGGVTSGTLCDENFIFGEGYLKALNLEQNVADYQRIIVDPTLVDRLIEPIKNSCTYKCADNNLMISYLETTAIEDGNLDFDTILESIKKHETALTTIGGEALKPRIDSIVNELCNNINPKTKELYLFEKITGKYSKIVKYHLDMCKKYNFTTTVTCPNKQSNLQECYCNLINCINEYDGNDVVLDKAIESFKHEYKKYEAMTSNRE